MGPAQCCASLKTVTFRETLALFKSLLIFKPLCPILSLPSQRLGVTGQFRERSRRVFLCSPISEIKMEMKRRQSLQGLFSPSAFSYSQLPGWESPRGRGAMHTAYHAKRINSSTFPILFTVPKELMRKKVTETDNTEKK